MRFVHEKEMALTHADATSWTVESVRELVDLARQRVPPSVMSLKLKRPITMVRAKLSELGISPPVEA